MLCYSTKFSLIISGCTRYALLCVDLPQCKAQARGDSGSVALTCGFNCPRPCRIFPDQGSDLWPLHWQVGFQPLDHQGSLVFTSFLIKYCCGLNCSVTKFCPTNSLQPHGLRHARLPCPSLSPRVRSNSCPLSQWCHPIFSSCPQSFLASGFFPMRWLFASGGQSIGVSASTSILPMNI